MRRPEHGFTLFEVLGAVALLALVYTVLATVAMRGLRAEGESQRILEASLLADWKLVALELQLDQGLVPPIGGDCELTDDPADADADRFETTCEVVAFEMPLAVSNDLDAPSPLDGLLGRARDGESAIREIRLRVSWFEGAAERSAVRTTYAIDLSTLPQLELEDTPTEPLDDPPPASGLPQ